MSTPQLTSKVRALIVDDEAAARTGLRDMLRAVEWITVVGEAANGQEAVQATDRLRPELVFLDIQMPGLPGTAVLERATHHPFVSRVQIPPSRLERT